MWACQLVVREKLFVTSENFTVSVRKNHEDGDILAFFTSSSVSYCVTQHRIIKKVIVVYKKVGLQSKMINCEISSYFFDWLWYWKFHFFESKILTRCSEVWETKFTYCNLKENVRDVDLLCYVFLFECRIRSNVVKRATFKQRVHFCISNLILRKSKIIETWTYVVRFTIEIS